MSDAACFTCLPEGVKPAVKLALLVRILQALNPSYVLNIGTLMERAACFLCIPPGPAIAALRLQLYCAILAGGGGGGGCVSPETPSNVTGNVDDPNPGDAFIEWAQALDPDLDFLVKWGTTSGVYTDQSPIGPQFRATGVLEGFQPDTTYYFIVVARNSETCVSANSPEVSFTTGPNPTPPVDPDPPRNLAWPFIHFTWIIPLSGQPALDYLFASGPTSGGPYTNFVSVPATQTTLSNPASGVNFGVGVHNYCVVYARNSVGSVSAPSNQVLVLVP